MQIGGGFLGFLTLFLFAIWTLRPLLNPGRFFPRQSETGSIREKCDFKNRQSLCVHYSAYTPISFELRGLLRVNVAPTLLVLGKCSAFGMSMSSKQDKLTKCPQKQF